MDGRLNLFRREGSKHHLSSPCRETGVGTTTLAAFKERRWGHRSLSLLSFQGNDRNIRGVPSSSLYVSFLVLLKKRGRENGRPALVHPSILACPFGEGKEREGEAVLLPPSLLPLISAKGRRHLGGVPFSNAHVAFIFL